MSNVILVNGLLTYDSGKTWFTIALAELLRRKGNTVAIYKPIAGHSAWYQFPTVIESLKHGILIGEDVLKYKKLLGLNIDLELVNPIDLLLAPPNPKAYKNIIKYINALEDQFHQVILFRISDYRNKATSHYIIRDNIDKIVPGLSYWIDKLIDKLNPKEILLTDLMRIMFSKKSLEILNRNLNILLENHDIVIVESFNDAAVPYIDVLDDVDVVFTVTPGYVFLLDREEFKSVVKEYYLKYGDMGLRMSNLLGRIRILFDTFISPSTSPVELSYYIEKINEIILKHIS